MKTAQRIIIEKHKAHLDMLNKVTLETVIGEIGKIMPMIFSENPESIHLEILHSKAFLYKLDPANTDDVIHIPIHNAQKETRPNTYELNRWMEVLRECEINFDKEYSK